MEKEIKNKFIDEDLDVCDDSCDLNPDKICDNCGKCIEDSSNYKIIKITKIITDNMDLV